MRVSLPKMLKQPRRKQVPVLLIVSLMLVSLYPFISPSLTFAAVNPQQVWLRLDRLKDSQATGGLVCLKTAASNSGTEAKVKVTFPTGFTVNTTNTNWTVTTTNLPNGASAWPSIATATTASGQDVTFASGDLTANTLYCFNFAASSTLTNATAGDSQTGQITTLTSGDVEVEQGNYAVSIISEDQITVTATVPPILTLSLTGTSVAHGTLTAGTVDYGSVTAHIGTNAAAGWVAWVKANTTYLNSATVGGTAGRINTVGTVDDATSTLSGGTYGWLLDVIPTDSANGTGTLTQAANYGAEYDGDNTCSSATAGGALDTAFQPIAASSGTTDDDTLELCSLLRVAPYQSAANDYTATLTFSATGRF
jgi:hypothetical protein